MLWVAFTGAGDMDEDAWIALLATFSPAEIAVLSVVLEYLESVAVHRGG